MMQKKGKLELTWVGKYDEKEIEPRILVEDKSKSYGDPDSENMLIHGDNLIALKALEQDYAGKIKCIYIDPPYNTGSRIDSDGKEIGYEDGLEHSIWLNMMYSRLKVMFNLLAENGAIFVHLDDNESDYCKIILDEIFGRENFMNRITVDARSPSAFSTVNPGMFVASEHILYYAKNRSKLYEKRVKTVRDPDSAYDKFIVNFEENYSEWKFENLSKIFSEQIQNQSIRPDKLLKRYHKFILENAHRIIRFTAISDTGAGKNVVAMKYESLKQPDKLYRIEREKLDDIYIINGQQIAFYSKNVAKIDGQLVATKMLTDIWGDIAWEGIANEGNVTFKKGKKPEKLIRRCFDLVTEEGDYVLDSFLGSGTTAAVAHKMGRKWIGIELGDHAYTHCKVRMDKVIDGEQGGISKAVNWQGGGGYKFYELAPSLLVPNPKLPTIKQINPEYTFEMMCEAICKLEGFKYKPDGKFHGKSSEQRFIHITKEFVNGEHINSLLANLGEGQSLLVYGMKIQSGLRLPENIIVKKIPKDLLDKCTFESEVR